jgi:hypothetical protein
MGGALILFMYVGRCNNNICRRPWSGGGEEEEEESER